MRRERPAPVEVVYLRKPAQKTREPEAQKPQEKPQKPSNPPPPPPVRK